MIEGESHSTLMRDRASDLHNITWINRGWLTTQMVSSQFNVTLHKRNN